MAMRWVGWAVLLIGASLGGGGCAAPPSSPSDGTSSTRQPGVVSFVKVLSDKVEDVSSLAAWRRSFLRDGMSDEEKARAIWTSVVKFRHQDTPPFEYVQSPQHEHDPIRAFNVYGYARCCCAAAFVEELARQAGLPTRGRTLRAHSVPEVWWGGAWHVLDGSLINWFPSVRGALAGVDDVIAGVTGWYAQHPGVAGNDPLITAMREDGRWHDGPPLLAACPFLDAEGLFPANVQGWDTAMRDYDGSVNAVEEYGSTIGYQVNLQLRPGERVTRRWSNHGAWVNQADGFKPESLDAVVGKGSFAYSPGYGDLAPGRIGNGTVEYDAPLGSPAFLDAALVADNLTAGQGSPALAVTAADRAATLVLRRPTSWVYLAGALDLSAAVGEGGAIDVFVSLDNGLDWQPLAHLDASGDRRIDLGPSILRRSDYRVKLVLAGAGTGLDALRFSEEFQHSQRPLPALAEGDNTITFSAGPPEGTITIAGNVDPGEHRALRLVDFHPVVDSLGAPPLGPGGAHGSITFPIETPGDLLRIRFSGLYRALAAGDAWDVRASFDGGATFSEIARLAGPTSGDVGVGQLDAVPAGTREALVEFVGTRVDTLFFSDLRVDADYREPAGGFSPVKVTYRWQEAGVARTDVHVARSPSDSWTIHCAARPTMKEIVVELAE